MPVLCRYFVPSASIYRYSPSYGHRPSVNLVENETKKVVTPQDMRRLLSDARAAPPLIFGTMTNSSTVTFESSTLYSSTSRMVSGGLKFHCWRTISRNELPPSEDQRKANSCVRGLSFSSKTSDICLSACGWSKISRIVWGPGS